MEGPNAVLNTMTLPPGATNTQPRMVIDGIRGAIFMYGSGGPVGALVGSWARTAGTDPYGNAYPAGFSLSGGVGETFLFYSPSPGANNLLLSINPSSSFFTDAFGNIVLSGFTVYTTLFSGHYYAINVGIVQASPLILGVEVWQSSAANQSGGWTGGAIFQWVQATNRVALNQPLQLFSYEIFPEIAAPAAIASNVIIYFDVNGTLQLVPPSGVSRTALMDVFILAQQAAGPTVASGDNALWADNTNVIHVSDSVGGDARFKHLETIYPTQSSAPSAISGTAQDYADTNGVRRSICNPDGNTYALGANTNTFTGSQTISSTTPTQVTNMSAKLLANVRYAFEFFALYTGVGATGNAVFSLGGTATFSANGSTDWSQAFAPGTYVGAVSQSSPTLTTTRQYVRLRGFMTVSVTGTLTANAAISSGGSNFNIVAAQFRLEPT